VRDYARGAWEALNYVIRRLEKSERETALREFRTLKDELEAGVAVNFEEKLGMI